MEIIRTCLIRILGIAVISAVALAITPEGSIKKLLGIVCGFATVTVIISTFSGFDFVSFSSYMSQYRETAESITAQALEKTSVETRLIIEERCAAYILDKAEKVGASVSASVKAVWHEDGYWYPSEADIVFSGSNEAEIKLRDYISAELGIAPEKQNWSEYD